MSYQIALVSILLLFSDAVISSINAETIPLENCGQRTAQTLQLVSHGDQSRLGEWPWHVAVMQRLNRSSPIYACGGTIITSRFILTAAHCMYPPSRVRHLNPSEVLIRAGIANLLKVEHSFQQKTVEKVTVHEDYHSDKFVNDIAILKLSDSLEFNDFVKPICLWTDLADEKLIVGKLGHLAGWGKNEHDEMPDLLQHAVMPIVSREDCRNSDPTHYTTYLFDWKCICAGFRNGTAPGTGDSGGGLYIERDGKWILRGIVSNGKLNQARKLDTYTYIVFTDVAYFAPWIKNKTITSSVEVVQPVEGYFTCGKKKERQFTRAGFAEERKWPWEGDVYRQRERVKPTRLCQTAVINENFVLSPASPFSDMDIYNSSQIMVDFSSSKSKEVRKVSRIIWHPEYDPYNRASQKSNLALLELNVPLKFSDLIRPICLWMAEQAAVKIDDISDSNTCATEFKINSTLLGNHSLCKYHGTKETAMPNLLYVQYGNSWYLRGISYRLITSEKNNTKKYYIAAADIAYYNIWIEENAVVKSQNLFRRKDCRNETYSWIYEILLKRIFQCYGSLILPNLLLTIASCVDGKPLEDLLVWKLKYNLESGVENVYLHPAFDKLQLTNNIAVVEMTSQNLFYPRRICIPNSFTPLAYLELSILHIKNNSSHTFTTAGVESCAERWQRQRVRVTTNGQHVCGFIQNDTAKVPLDCTADLRGAPLVYNSDDGEMSFLRGLLDVSKNDHCDKSDLPEVFIDVIFYVDWISTFTSPRKESSRKKAKSLKSAQSSQKQLEKTTMTMSWSQMN